MSNEERLVPANFNRPPRLQFPELKDTQVELPAPPALAPLPDQNLAVTLLPVLGIGVMALFYVLRAVAGGSADSLLFALPMLFLAVFTIGGTVLAGRWRRRDYEKRQRDNAINYIRLLEKKRVLLQAARDAQRGILETNFPGPDGYLSRALLRDRRLWERRPEDADFVGLRLGIGRIPAWVNIVTPSASVDSEQLDRAFALADAYRYLNDAPVVIPLAQDASVGVYGKRLLVLKAVRAAICHLAVSHAPHDLHIHLIASQSSYDDWRWIEWLPHASQSHRGGAADLVAFDHDNIRNLMGTLAQVVDERREGRGSKIPHLLLVVDGPQLVDTEAVFSTILREGHQVGASAICLVNAFDDVPTGCGAVVEIRNDESFHYTRTRPPVLELEGRAVDGLSLQDTEHIARALSSVTIRETGGGGRIPRRVDFLDLYGVRDVQELPPLIHQRWRRPIPRGVLPHPVLIGSESLAAHTQLLLDEDHHGPHGMLAGTTGSGKSELLQTLICSMILEHDPRLLTFLLIDFKGGSTFNIFSELPHTVGAVTNLDGALVERALEALKAEIEWRQLFLKRMNVRDITQYHRYYARADSRVQDENYQPLPHLFVIVDEFAQLAKEMPDFLRELVRTVQLGRSLGLHLILGTQSPMDVITDEMNANLQFRICLRVQNIEASRAMLRRPDAAYLPAGWPGRGYFQVGERGVFKQFQTAYVGADYVRRRADDSQDTETVLELITDSGQVVNLLPDPRATLTGGSELAIETGESYTVARAICDTVIAYAKAHGIPRMKPLLLPPLRERITLGATLENVGYGGWNGRDWLAPGRDHEFGPIRLGSAPVGLIDDVYNRTQNPLWIHLNSGEQERAGRKDGHVLVIGSPGSGKTNFLRALAISEALLHPPGKLHMYFLSFTGTGLNDLGNLPHAEAVVQGTETERVRRLFGRLIHTLNERQAGRQPRFSPIIMVCIDQYEQLRDTYRDQHLLDFERLINEGRSVGIYLVITASTVTAVPDRIRSLIQQRIALQLGDVTDYVLAVGRLDRRVNPMLPAGRGFIYHSPPLMVQIALPSLRPTVESEQDALVAMNALIEEMRDGYQALTGQSQAPAPLRELPTDIPLHTLDLAANGDRHNDYHIRTPLGRYDDDALAVYTLDWWNSGPHFVVSGPPGSGKTNLLQAAILAAARLHSPRHVRFLLVDVNGRSFRSLAALKHVIRRVADPMDLKDELGRLHADLQAFDSAGAESDRGADRVPPVPATVVVIDDYDALSEDLRMSEDVLAHLRDIARLYGDLNLYIWVAGYLERAADPLIRYVLLKRSGFGLSVKESLQKLNVRVAGLPSDTMPVGRAFVPEDNTVRVVQIAHVADPQEYVQRINDELWPADSRATWESPHTAPLPAPRRLPPASAQTPAHPVPAGPLDIDIAGLIEDLLGGLVNEERENADT